MSGLHPLSKEKRAGLEDWANTPQRQRAYAQEGLIVDVAETIYEAMDMRRVLRVDLAKKLGCSKALVSQMLNGKRNMSLRTLADIADALGYKVEIRFRGKKV